MRRVRRTMSVLLPFVAAAVVGTGPAGAAAPGPGGAARLELVSPSARRTLSLDDLRRVLTAVSVTVDDPVYETRKTYQGVRLADLLALLPSGGELVDEVVFHTRDGYAPTLGIAAAREGQGLVAFRDTTRRAGFAPVRQGKISVDPGPFYLVWTGPNATERPWPYQLVGIELVSFRRTYDRLFPADADPGGPVARGFLAFRSHCLRCHSVNLQGGDLGPELNVPRSVTEYRDTATLRQFIRDAPSFRARSKMPPFPQLDDAALDDLLAYLGHMKDRKRTD
jgi:mono/diheme cytochrome c family protein